MAARISPLVASGCARNVYSLSARPFGVTAVYLADDFSVTSGCTTTRKRSVIAALLLLRLGGLLRHRLLRRGRLLLRRGLGHDRLLRGRLLHLLLAGRRLGAALDDLAAECRFLDHHPVSPH